ncbi:MAG: T9SS type A sorting domain-containing protein [Flavobacteriales bacterium]|nr:T9SS type A sorting domain-containing protein [Flavobacteriales bacterium]
MSQRLVLGAQEVPVVRASAFDAEFAANEDAERETAGKLPLYARFVEVAADVANEGFWTELPGGGRIWRLRVESAGAMATELFFSDAHIPAGAQLHVYDALGEQVLGGYTAAHVQPNGILTTDMILGESCVIEYHEPASVRGEGSLRLTRLLHAYRMASMLKTGACEVDVNCSEGSAWTDQRDAVVRIRIVIPTGAGFCTGTLMNNTALDCKGYILTAFHCTEESVEGNYPAYQFRFNFQRTVCGTGSSTGNGLTGCVRRAGSQDQGGTYGSDYSLLELTAAIPAAFYPYWAGWDVTANAPASGVCIHHPDSDVKKISTFSSTASSATWAGFTNGSHWRVVWVATANGHGVTEPGSSGAPLFNPNKRVVGTLTGGSSCCTTNGCGSGTSLTGPDLFGKMGYHWWENNPNPTEEELHWWLAPVGNPTFQNGSRNPCGPIGVEEVGMVAPEVFPNPVQDAFTVVLPDELISADLVRVIDLAGRAVHEERVGGPRFTIRSRDWSAGCYMLCVLEQGRMIGSARLIR